MSKTYNINIVNLYKKMKLHFSTQTIARKYKQNPSRDVALVTDG